MINQDFPQPAKAVPVVPSKKNKGQTLVNSVCP